ncbi:MAG: PQQ-binding-like beta-propeller repeat protein [Planctomycetota bacterium]|nr:PQQ-binding-like beta-propeller repeat protein [Planctomycetota bacterium]
MYRKTALLLQFLLSLVVVTPFYSPLNGAELRPAEFAHNWPAWRGPLATGVAPHADPPVEWSETKNVRWKTEIPGVGHSTPIVWGDRIFLTTAVPYGDELEPRFSGAPGAHDNVAVTRRHEFRILAINRANGEIIWSKTLKKELPHEGGHYTASLASNSPVTNGTSVFASFGSRGVFCLDFDGKVRWEKQFGVMNTKHGHGEGSSPVLFGDSLIVNWDHEGESFVVVLDQRTGEQKWKIARNEVTSWATPIVVEHNQQPQVIVCGSDRVRGYDLKNGDVIWECGGLSKNIVASPVAQDGMVFAASSYDTRAMLAIRLDGARGNISDSKNVAWSRATRTPYVPSPLLYGNSVYFLRHYQGILSRVSTESGDDILGSPYRLGSIDNVYASPVAAANRVYVTDLSGTTMIVSHTDEAPKLLGRNRLDENFSASMALVGKDLFLRGKHALYCIADDSKSAGQ